MDPGSRGSLLRSLLGLALCAVVVAGCGKGPQPVTPRPTASVSLTLRAQPEGVFTPRFPGLEGVSGDQWFEDHYARIVQKLTPASVGTEEIKQISLEGERITIRTHVEDIADLEQQAVRIEQLLSDLYADLELASASTREATPSDLDEVERVPPNIALFTRYLEATPSDLDEIKQILEARAEAAGLSDLSVHLRPPDSVFVEFACAGDPEWAKAVLTETGLLEIRVLPRRYAHGTNRMLEVSSAGGRLTHTFRDETGAAVGTPDVLAESPVIVSGRDFAPTSRVEAGPNRPTGVTFSLRDEAGEAFYVFTRDHVNTYLPMVFDGELIVCPMIRSAIPGEGMIVADFDEPGGRERAEKLAILINSGPLPLDLECTESTTEQLPP